MKTFIFTALLGVISAQQVGTQKKEFHPELSLSTCTKSGGCAKETKNVTMDANWRWTHELTGYANCYSGSSWAAKDCPDPDTCAESCAIDGVDSNDMKGTYGVTTDGTTVKLDFVTQGQYSKNIGSRMYMMDSETDYHMFQLKNREFSFTVDVSQLPCGLNGALYFVEMEKDGGLASGKHNAAGAKYGTGYCDAQCPHDVKFINGEANILDWDTTTAKGLWGSCCAEFDIWEANKISTAYTSHPCQLTGPKRCENSTDCGNSKDGNRYKGWCDKDGCDFNTYRSGVKDFFGPGSMFKIDATKPVQVITQFLTHDNSDTGDITEIRRVWVQDGQVFQQPMTQLEGSDKQYDSITTEMCSESKKIFGDTNDFDRNGGMKSMSDALGRGMVLVMSLWDDHDDYMLWLDSTDPIDKTTQGGPRGTCSTSSGRPDDVEGQHPDAYVKYGDIKVGEIGSTFTNNVEEFTQ